MPFFDYQCKNEECKEVFEVNLGRNELDEVIPKCPKCKSECKRIISGGSCFILKGDGWAKDGYSESSNKKE